SRGVERNAEREPLSGANQARGFDDVLRRDMIEGADMVVFTPPAPVFELLRRLGDCLSTDLDVHFSRPCFYASRSGQRAALGCTVNVTQMLCVVRRIICRKVCDRKGSSMKLLSFAAEGKDWFGALRDDGVITLNDKVAQPSLRASLAAGAVDTMRSIAQRAAPDRKLNEIKFLPVIPLPGKILCAGINYRSHAVEMARELPKQPTRFMRFADSVVGHGGELIPPKIRDNFDFEGGLALVIGKGGRHITAERALEHVAGYTCFVDGSVRDYQKFSVTSGKNFPGTG